MSTPKDIRLQCRKEILTTHTSGLAPGYMQANLIILPSSVAEDFYALCKRNPVPCPLIGRTVGGPTALDNELLITKNSKNGFDIRTDFPQYRIYHKGKLQGTANNCLKQWQDGYVGFLIGCSYSFEGALIEAGLPPKNMIRGTNVTMYKTSKIMDPAGVFVGCPYVVSMRPYKKKDIDTVRKVTSKYALTHGEPIDWGYDGANRLGIHNLNTPDYGDPIDIQEDEIPVFWGCGVTPQLAVETLGDIIETEVISHSPGCMLVLDVTYDDYSKLKE